MPDRAIGTVTYTERAETPHGPRLGQIYVYGRDEFFARARADLKGFRGAAIAMNEEGAEPTARPETFHMTTINLRIHCQNIKHSMYTAASSTALGNFFDGSLSLVYRVLGPRPAGGSATGGPSKVTSGRPQKKLESPDWTCFGDVARSFALASSRSRCFSRSSANGCCQAKVGLGHEGVHLIAVR